MTERLGATEVPLDKRDTLPCSCLNATCASVAWRFPKDTVHVRACGRLKAALPV